MMSPPRSPNARTLDKVGELIKKTILKTYTEHITPFWALSDPQCPAILLIVGVRVGSKVRVWKVFNTAVAVCPATGFVGIGAENASRVARWLYKRPMPLGVAMLIANEIILETKANVPNCGGGTHICLLPSGSGPLVFTGTSPNEDREFFFGLYSLLESVLLSTVNTSRPDASLDEDIARLHHKLMRIRERLKECDPDPMVTMRAYLKFKA